MKGEWIYIKNLMTAGFVSKKTHS